MKAFFVALANSALQAGLQGAASSSNAKADIRTIGISAGLAALVGGINFLIQHPMAAHPSVQIAVSNAAMIKPNAQ